MKNLIVGLFLIAAALAAPAGMAADIPGVAASAQAFTQKFYDWYLQEVNRPHNGFTAESVLKSKPQLFDAPLKKALDEDFAASAKSPDEIVGLDFDPFLAAQDICTPYTTGKVTQEGGTYRVEVFGHGCSEKPGQPDVIAALKQVQGAWIFVNFFYPGNSDYPGDGDLLSVLKMLKKEREHPSS